MKAFYQDLYYGLRGLMKQPGVTLIAVLSLALGIGANTAIFGVVNTVLLNPLPGTEEPHRLVRLMGGDPSNKTNQYLLAAADFLDIKQHSGGVFESIVAYTWGNYNLTSHGEPESVIGWQIQADYFRVLGIRPRHGRLFTPEEHEPGGKFVALLGHKLWQRRFAGDPKIIGEHIRINGDSYKVVGVMPPGCTYPFTESELWTPLAFSPAQWTDRRFRSLSAAARLKPGVTAAQAQTLLRPVGERWQREFTATHRNWIPLVFSSIEDVIKNVRPALLTVFFAVGFVLLIACANVSNLLLARGVARRSEMAIRSALGASRPRLVRMLLTESALFSIIGGILSLPLANITVKLLLGFFPKVRTAVLLPRVEQIPFDLWVFGFAFLISVLCGLLCGLIPALRSSKTDLLDTLKEGRSGKGVGSGFKGWFRAGNLIVIFEVALALLLLSGAGVMIKSFMRLTGIDPGFDFERLLTARLSLLDNKRYEPEEPRRILAKGIISGLKSVPGVEGVGLCTQLPVTGGGTYRQVTFVRKQMEDDVRPRVYLIAIDPEFFRALDARLLKGRVFTENDNQHSPPVIIINRSLALKYYPNEDPLGKYIKIAQGSSPKEFGPREIVGVADDLKNDGLDQEAHPEVYSPYFQEPLNRFSIVLRTKSDPMSYEHLLRRIVSEQDKEMPIFTVTTFEQLVGESLAPRRIATVMLGIYAVIAFALAAMGIYGVLTHATSARAREMGIRLALGAQPNDLLRMVIRQGMTLVMTGLGLGMILAFALTRLIASQLYQVSPTDPATFALTAVLLAAVALTACFFPALRATKVDPITTLREG
ncbi:MAG: ABC transporter permease [Blastocatellia bacterium]